MNFFNIGIEIGSRFVYLDNSSCTGDVSFRPFRRCLASCNPKKWEMAGNRGEGRQGQGQGSFNVGTHNAREKGTEIWW